MNTPTILILAAFTVAALCLAFVGITRIKVAKISLEKRYNYAGPSGYEIKQSWKKLMWGIAIVVIFISIGTALTTYVMIRG